jgi:hypothetical protein
MNLTKMIGELRAQKQALEETMAILERLARGQGKRRGRPPAFLSELSGVTASPAGKTRKRKPFSAATRKKMAEAQRLRWAAHRKKKAS